MPKSKKGHSNAVVRLETAGSPFPILDCGMVSGLGFRISDFDPLSSFVIRHLVSVSLADAKNP